MPVHGDDVATPVEESDNLPTHLCNDGYDDDHGDYLVLMGDHLAYRYEVLNALGQGSFGQVVCCLDHRTRKQVAVKIIRNRRKYRDQALVEVQLLEKLQRAATDWDDNPHIVRMEEYFQFRDHVCIVFEVLGMNLYDFLKMRYFRGLPMNSVRTIGKQLAQSLAFLKQQQVVHCDLKPENVLLDALQGEGRNSDNVENVTLIDFGSSCMEEAPIFTYIQSRFYRSPEVLLGHMYSSAIDMWSFACILVELHTGHPIFAGENEREQFACIMEVLDMPPVEMVRKSKRRLNFFDEVTNPANIHAVDYVPKPFVNSRGRRRTLGSHSLASAVKTDDPEFLAFLTKCFVWDPSQRLTPEQALHEPWMRHHQYRINPVEYEL
ncbi:CMGC/DYRK/DYRK2 protein kinase [Phytophthora palmivora]|uniref:CMGC/DYRK/DYRK2 protein kinase n=1 Tax=Phytophthora palmivora TaxID=4796 RepID=A0A2P4YBS5_9STRA|nr:CMGC/DYRK/DYRK2 protein kinase [Phytophthora palmivora]